MEFPLSVLEKLKTMDLPSVVEEKPKAPKKIKQAPETGAPLSAESKEKLKTLTEKKAHTSISVKSDSKPQKRKSVETPVKREKRPPAPIKWRSRDVSRGDDHTKHWAYKRNYMGVYFQCDGENFPYEIWEISDRDNHKLVLQVDYCPTNEGLVERIEECIRSLGKGYGVKLNPHEVEHAKYFKENIKFVPYEETDAPKPMTTEEERIKNAQEEERLMKILAERRSKLNDNVHNDV